VALNKLTQSQSAEQAIHHVDSVLGLLLAVLIFLTNIVLSQVMSRSLVVGATFATLTTILVIMDIAFWILGVLLQVWLLKFLAWYFVAFGLVSDLEMVILSPLLLCCIFSLNGVSIFVLLLLASLVSVLFCWFVVRRAYVERLIAAGAQREAEDLNRIATQMCVALGVGVPLVLLLKLVGML
jgi:hypothetical protein